MFRAEKGIRKPIRGRESVTKWQKKKERISESNVTFAQQTFSRSIFVGFLCVRLSERVFGSDQTKYEQIETLNFAENLFDEKCKCSTRLDTIIAEMMKPFREWQTD